MEARLAALLKSELEKNLNEIVEGSGGNQWQDPRYVLEQSVKSSCPT